MRRRLIFQWGLTWGEWSVCLLAKYYRDGARGVGLEIGPLRLGFGSVLRREDYNKWIERVI